MGSQVVFNENRGIYILNAFSGVKLFASLIKMEEEGGQHLQKEGKKLGEKVSLKKGKGL